MASPRLSVMDPMDRATVTAATEAETLVCPAWFATHCSGDGVCSVTACALRVSRPTWYWAAFEASATCICALTAAFW